MRHERIMTKLIVLVVEEEALVRMSAVHMVEDAGYAVLQACNADEAIEILERRSDVRVVFTDFNMSGSMDGLRLVQLIRGRWPPIHLIVASGLDVQDKLPANGRFILKPYAAEHVTGVLGELFGDNPAPLLSNNGSGCTRAA